MSLSSIHIIGASPSSEMHNDRTQELDYVHSELSKNNEIWVSEKIGDRKKKIAALCKTKSGRKMQKNAMPIREGVVNLNANHSMEDLKKLAKELEARFEIKCFQIYIHRDEGKSKDELNHHGHMVFDWQDKKTGKMLRLKKTQLSQMQTLVANSLGMTRGELRVNSNREHLAPVEYKRQQEEIRVKELQEKTEILEQKKNTASKRNREARTRDEEAHRRYCRKLEAFTERYAKFQRDWNLSEFKTKQERKEVFRRIEEEIARDGSIENEISKLEEQCYLFEDEAQKYKKIASEIERNEREIERLAKQIQLATNIRN